MIVAHHPQDGHPSTIGWSLTIPWRFTTVTRAVTHQLNSRMVNQPYSKTNTISISAIYASEERTQLPFFFDEPMDIVDIFTPCLIVTQFRV